ncbi:MAG: TIGR02453 family protein [Kordia sp.]|nr:MAG: TIGR02453 family protein [Kordia sp.]
MTLISKETVSFLKELSENNNREWFSEHKKEFKEHEATVKLFFQSVFEKLSATDDIEAYKMMRIYRDVRFSKDKTPYKARFAGSFKRSSERLRGGYFLNLEPGNCVVGGGFYGPNPADLLRIRKEFELDALEINEILSDKAFKKIFPNGIQGEGVKTAPKGFDKNNEAIVLIRKKQFYVMKSFTDSEMTSEKFVDEVVSVFVTLRPFFDYMSEVLTTNLNGESILEGNTN